MTETLELEIDDVYAQMLEQIEQANHAVKQQLAMEVENIIHKSHQEMRQQQ